MADPQNQKQMQELSEKLKSMSPEELREFQKKQCIFCQIIGGAVQSKKVYEDDTVFATLDINPANPGHILLLTKEHYSIMPQIPEPVLSHMTAVIQQLSNALLRGLEAEGTNVIIANGVAAGQRAQHFMMHLIPRKENDGLTFSLPQKTHQGEVLSETANKIITVLYPLLGMPYPDTFNEITSTGTVPTAPPMKNHEPNAAPEVNLDDIAKLLGGK